MKMKHIGLLLIIVLLLAGCNGTDKKTSTGEVNLTDSIAGLENELFNQNASRIDRDKAIKLVDFYSQYATEFPDDSLSPEYLYKASDISMNLNRPVETIQLFDRMLTEYPDFEKTPTTLFLKAFVYEDQMNDLDNARKYYQLFIEKYPDSEFADDAKVSLENLGKSPEDLIKEFEENSN